jgi:hypothetical protein
MVGIPLTVLTVSSIVLVAKYRRMVVARRPALASAVKPAAIALLLIAFTSMSDGSSIVSNAPGPRRGGEYRLGGGRT